MSDTKAEPLAPAADNGDIVNMDDLPLPALSLSLKYALLFLASFVIMAQAAQICDDLPSNIDCEDENAYAVSAGAISAFVCGVFLIINYLKMGSEKMAYFFSIGLFIWWVPAVGVLTFDAPFTSTVVGNGYFATWACFLISLNLVYSQGITSSVSSKFDSMTSKQKAVSLVFIGSFVEMVAASIVCRDINDINGLDCKEQSAWAVAVGVLSLVLCAVWLLLGAKLALIPKAELVLSVVLFILWIFGAGVCTIDDPFSLAGNGYFACWVCFIISGSLAVMEVTGESSGLTMPSMGGGDDADASGNGDSAPEQKEGRAESF